MRIRLAHLLTVLLGLLVLPHAWLATSHFVGQSEHWARQGWGSAGLVPVAAETPEAVIHVYAARAHGWRGIFGDHTWLVMKRAEASAYDRYEVVGWGLAHGGSSVRLNMRAPDGFWAGNPPRVIAELRGAEAEAVIGRVEEVIEAYPYSDRYRVWPGPNSNSFIAHIGREVPELGLHMPATAVGKDFLPGGRLLAPTPSGSGWQVSLFGVAGASIGRVEGFELNVLGLTLGLEPNGPALKLPGLGRLGFS